LSLFSVPYDYPGQPVDSVINSGGQAVKLAVWDPTAMGYAITPNAPADEIRLGRGYWIRLNAAGSLASFGTPADTTKPFSIPVEKGWNMIGEPFLSGVSIDSLQIAADGQTVAFATAVSNGWVYGTVYGYNGGTTNAYYSAGVLATGSGYWLYAYAPATVMVPSP
jgi:hypothetical protein